MCVCMAIVCIGQTDTARVSDFGAREENLFQILYMHRIRTFVLYPFQRSEVALPTNNYAAFAVFKLKVIITLIYSKPHNLDIALAFMHRFRLPAFGRIKFNSMRTVFVFFFSLWFLDVAREYIFYIEKKNGKNCLLEQLRCKRICV